MRIYSLTAILALLCALASAACGTNSSRTKHRSRGFSVAAITPGSVRHVRPFPRLSRGASCPRTPGGHATHHEQITLGHGPVYPILGSTVEPPAAGGVIDFQAEGNAGRHYGLWGNKVLFAVSPNYTRPFTVQGKQIDGVGPIDWLIEKWSICAET